MYSIFTMVITHRARLISWSSLVIILGHCHQLVNKSSFMGRWRSDGLHEFTSSKSRCKAKYLSNDSWMPVKSFSRWCTLGGSTHMISQEAACKLCMPHCSFCLNSYKQMYALDRFINIHTIHYAICAIHDEWDIIKVMIIALFKCCY